MSAHPTVDLAVAGDPHHLQGVGHPVAHGGLGTELGHAEVREAVAHAAGQVADADEGGLSRLHHAGVGAVPRGEEQVHVALDAAQRKAFACLDALDQIVVDDVAERVSGGALHATPVHLVDEVVDGGLAMGHGNQGQCGQQDEHGAVCHDRKIRLAIGLSAGSAGRFVAGGR